MATRRRRPPDRVSEGRVAFDFMPRYLLDTATVIRWAAPTLRASARARAVINNPEAPCFVSAVSIYEIVAKHALGKLPVADPFVSNIRVYLDEQEFITLGLSTRHAEIAGRLGGHRDPFDRLLAAQAIADGLVMVSPDPVFDGWGIQRVW